MRRHVRILNRIDFVDMSELFPDLVGLLHSPVTDILI